MAEGAPSSSGHWARRRWFRLGLLYQLTQIQFDSVLRERSLKKFRVDTRLQLVFSADVNQSGPSLACPSVRVVSGLQKCRNVRCALTVEEAMQMESATVLQEC